MNSDLAQEAGFDMQLLQGALQEFGAPAVNFHSLIIERHGKVVSETYRDGKDRGLYRLWSSPRHFDADQLHDMRSVTRSVVGLLWGIAHDKGLVPPLDAPVMALYPELKRLARRGRQSIQIRHLLTMSSGLFWREINAGTMVNNEFRLYWRKTAPYLFLRPMMAPPGMRFNYNAGCTALLADIITGRTGMTLPEFARTYLFEPLGITHWEWINDVRGRPLPFTGLRMRPADLVRIGRMVLQQGVWEERQIVSAAWVANSTRAHIDTGDGRQYGFHWWLGMVDNKGGKLPWFAAFGNGGQRLYVAPELDLIVVITAGAYNTQRIGQQCNSLLKRIVAAVEA